MSDTMLRLHFSLALFAAPAIAAEPVAHWPFCPVVDSPPPAVRDATRVRSPIDRFILAKLDAVSLTPVAPAGKRATIVDILSKGHP